MGVAGTLFVFAGALQFGAAGYFTIPMIVLGLIIEIIYMVYLNRARRTLDGALLIEQ